MRDRSSDRLTRSLFSARQGSDAALEDLLCVLRPGLLDYARRQLKEDTEPEETARDLTQEALIRVVENVDSCRAEDDAQVLAWALSIMRNLCRDHFRRSRAWGYSVRLSLDVPDIADPALVSLATDAEDLRWRSARRSLNGALRQVVARLPASAVRLLRMRLQDEKQWREIGSALGTSEEGARKRFKRLRSSMRAELLRRIDALAPRDRSAVLRYLRR